MIITISKQATAVLSHLLNVEKESLDEELAKAVVATLLEHPKLRLIIRSAYEGLEEVRVLVTLKADRLLATSSSVLSVQGTLEALCKIICRNADGRSMAVCLLCFASRSLHEQGAPGWLSIKTQGMIWYMEHSMTLLRDLGWL